MKNNLTREQKLKTGGTATLTTLVRDKKKGHMLVKGTIHQDVTTANTNLPNIKAPISYKHQRIEKVR